MRICVVSSEYPPFHGGGIGTYSAIQSRALAEAGHDVHVISNCWSDYFLGEPAGTAGKIGRGSLSVHRLDVLTTDYCPRPPHAADNDPIGQVCRYWDSSLYWSMNVADELARLHDQNRIDVVEYPECFAEGYIALRRRRLGDPLLDIPMTVTLHSPIREVIEYNRYRKWQAWFHRRNVMEDYCMQNADTLCSPSQHLVNTLRHRFGPGFDRVPCNVIPNPMDFAPWSQADVPAPRGPDEGPYLLYVGRIEPRKGIQYLVDAALPLMARIPELKVVLIGRDRDAGDVPGSMKDWLIQRIPEAFKSRFVFEGIRPRHEILQRYGAATACVFPVPWDNFPYTCCEAMASGACVIASGNSGMAEMIEDDRSGILFPSGDVPALTAAISRVIEDHELRDRLRRAAPARIRALCDPAGIVDKRLDHYEQTIRRHRQNTPKTTVSAPPLPRLALFIAGDEQSPDSRLTLESVAAAADRACVSIEATAGEDTDSSLRNWIESLAHSRPDYFMVLHPGERVEQTYLSEAMRVFGSETGVAWTTSWAFSLDLGRPRPFAGFDFSVPLELLYYHSVPYAMISYAAFRDVGGWNLKLPSGWRSWDLYLAFEQAGLKGIVVPRWLAHFIPRDGRDLDVPRHGKAHELILEAVAERNASLFAEHAVSMYVNLATNPRYSSPCVNVHADEPPASNRNSSPAAHSNGTNGRHTGSGLRSKLVRKTIDLLNRWQ
jgi:glycosyltransferase involved in cell wall biosynthesis